jgi:hypothetical protein
MKRRIEMRLRQKLDMASKMLNGGLISETSYKLLLKGFNLIEEDKIHKLVNRYK